MRPLLWLCCALAPLAAAAGSHDVVPLVWSTDGGADGGALPLGVGDLNEYGQVVSGSLLGKLVVVTPLEGRYFADENRDGLNDYAHVAATPLDDTEARLGGVSFWAYNGAAYRLSDNGHVAYSVEAMKPGSGTRYYAMSVVQDGARRDLQPTGGDAFVMLRDVNRRGEVLGYSGGPTGCGSAVIWALGRGVPLRAPCMNPCLCSLFPHNFNNNAKVAGMVGAGPVVGTPLTDTQKAVLWDGTQTLLPGWYPNSAAVAVNDVGDAVGYSYFGYFDVDSVPIVWKRGQPQALPNLPNMRGCKAHDVNNLGQVVGRCRHPDATTYQNDRGFLYLPEPAFGLDAGVHDVDVLAGTERFIGAQRINDVGQVLVERWPGTGVLLTPRGAKPPAVGAPLGDTPYAETSRDPVSTLTGELVVDPLTDLDLGGPAALAFRRSYGSQRDRAGGATGPLGHGWRHGFEWSLSRSASGVVVVSPEGARTVHAAMDGGFGATTSALGGRRTVTPVGALLEVFDEADERARRFDADGRLVAVADRYGNTLTLAWDAGLGPDTIADGLGRQLALSYAADGRLASVSDGTRTVRYAVVNDELESVTGVLGDVTRYGYTDTRLASSLLTSIRRPTGALWVSQRYDATGRVEAQTDGTGAVTRFEFRPGGETRQTDPLSGVTTHVYEGGRLVRTIDPLGTVHVLAYDAQGRRAGASDDAGVLTSLTYDAATGLPSALGDARGVRVTHTFRTLTVQGRALVRRASTTWAGGGVETFDYDAAGRLSRWTDQSGRAFDYAWSPRGALTAFGPVDGGHERREYAADGTLTALTSAAGDVTRFGYDALRRVDRITFPADAGERRYGYDAAGRVLTFTDELGGRWRFEYDAVGNRVLAEDPLGRVTRERYDGMDRPLALTRPGGGTFQRTWDANGRLTSATDEAGVATQFDYDAAGRLSAVRDALGQTTQFTWDARGRVTRSVDPLGHAVDLVWDGGWLAEAKGPLGRDARYTWSAAGELAAVDTPDGRTTFTRDLVGRVTGITAPGGARTQLERGFLGVVTALTDPTGGVWRTEVDAAGRAVAQVDPLGNRTTSTYDARGRVKDVTFPGGERVEQQWDAAGRRVGLRSSDGVTLRFTRDAVGNLTGAPGLALEWSADDRLVASNGLELGRDAAGRLTRVRYAANKVVDYGYDAAGRVVSVRDWVGGETRLTRDALGRITGVSRPNGVNATREFDAAERPRRLAEAGPFGSSELSFTFDAAGKLLQARRAVPLPAGLTEAQAQRGTQTATYDAAHRPAGQAFDPRGRQLSDGQRTFTWSALSRLTAIGGGATFTYDGLGHLTARAVDGATQRFVWNYGLALPSIAVQQRGAEDAVYYVHLPNGQLLYSVDARTNARRWYHFDERGSTLFLTGDDGQITGAWAYGAYGNVLEHTGEDAPFTFLGRYGVLREGDTDLFHVRQRVYDAAAGRFLSRDPDQTRVHPAQVNPYRMGRQNPFRTLDVNGALEAAVLFEYGDTKGDAVVDGAVKVTDNGSWALEKVAERMQDVSEARHRGLVEAFRDADRVAKPDLFHLSQQNTRMGDLGKELGEVTNKTSAAVDVASKAIDLYKFNEKIEKIENEQQQTLIGTEKSFANLTEEVRRKRKEGQLSAATEYLWQQELSEAYDQMQEGATLAAGAQILEEMYRAQGQAVADLLPPPVSTLINETVLK